MAMFDEDWGTSQWDVDATAETLNKALFGKRRTKAKGGTSVIKPDLDVAGKKNKSGFAQDSDDDAEKLSKKAKKKLKARRRKDNVHSKKMEEGSQESESIDDEVPDGEERHQKNKFSKKQSKVLVEKKKVKSKDIKLEVHKKPNKALSIERKGHMEKDEEDVSKKNKKRKVSLPNGSNANTEGDISPKQKKTEESNEKVDFDEGGEPKNRKKKKKTSNKKNKYKHLGLKSDRPVVPGSDSDGESDHGSKNGNSRKRKISLSPDKVLAKKAKVLEDSNNFSLDSSEKQKKTSNVSEIGGVEDRKGKKNQRRDKINNKDETVEENKSVTKAMTEKLESGAKSKTQNKGKDKKLKETVDEVNSKPERKVNETSFVSPFFSSQGMEMQQKFKNKLVSGRFRFINQQLYTIKGGDAYRMFHQDKTLMDAYQTGFQSQVKQWSVNPLDVIIKQLSNKPPLLKVVDFGCGEARLSASVPQKVHSFDLYALNERVTVCNMAKTPLDSESVDIAVFCLSLMGTNLNDYLLEANRVLKEGGILKIAEVVSRFTNVNQFISAVSSMGFRAMNSRDLSKMFYLMDFKKLKSVKKSSKQIKALSLNPCVYKKR